ncbi:MAG: pilus assembly protein [Rhodospirillales bacterium]|nr:pilus assembly protein [Rhodospirillales bacterium]
MRGQQRSFLACCRGATAVEFAIVAPLFLAMMVGVFELSRAMWIKASMQYAVEETSRYAMVNTTKTDAELKTYAQTKLTDAGVGTTGMDFSNTTSDGTVANIEVSYSFQTLTSLLPFPSLALTAKSRVPLS